MAHGPLAFLTAQVARWARMLTIALPAGFASTVGTAWTLTLSDSPAQFSDATFRDRRPMVGEGLGRLILEWSTRPGVVRYDAWVYPTCVSTYSPGAMTPEQVVPRWASAAVLPWIAGRRPWPQASATSVEGPSTESTHLEAAGWPLPCMWHDYREALNTPSSSLARVAGSLLATDRSLPVRPIWCGLAADTLLFSAVWGILLALPRFATFVARVAHGRCSSCGYELLGLPPRPDHRVRCPECGGLCRAPRCRANSLLSPAI